MNDYNNKSNNYFFERNDEENSLNNFIENRSPLFNENDDEEENLIYKTKDFYINNNVSKLVTCENSPNNLCENESVEINNTNNNKLSVSKKTTDPNNYVLTQAELFIIPSDFVGKVLQANAAAAWNLYNSTTTIIKWENRVQ